jgi:hypothetical protein
MKAKFLIGFLVSLFVLAAMQLLAQAEVEPYPSERFPTRQELHILVQQFQREVSRLKQSQNHRDPRTPTEKQQVAAFRDAWSNNDLEVTPFLGKWTFVGEQALNPEFMEMIYPSKTKGQICLIETYPTSPTSEGAELHKGNVVSGAVKTSTDEVLIREEDFLGEVYVIGDEALLDKFAYPRLLEAPMELGASKRQP